MTTSEDLFTEISLTIPSSMMNASGRTEIIQPEDIIFTVLLTIRTMMKHVPLIYISFALTR